MSDVTVDPKPDGARTADKAHSERKQAESKQKTGRLGHSLLVQPGSFEAEEHFYPRVLNAGIHPMVGNFLRLGNERIAARYCHLNPKTDYALLLHMLETIPEHFRWSGCDLFNVTNEQGQRQMIVIETNSCPSGQKSMPVLSEEDEADGYHRLIKTTFKMTMDEKKDLPKGDLAVVYDKNPMEASGYAAAMADVFREPVHLVELYEDDVDPPVRFEGGVMHVRTDTSEWVPIRAAFRYVTQKPWTRLPVSTKTFILNPIVACLAGGRNKMAADKAYEFLNKEMEQLGPGTSGMMVRVPETIRDVSLEEIPLWVKSMGGHAVVKVPYSNAGQGVYTICNDKELDAFMGARHDYDKFIVQSLVGNASWSSLTGGGRFFHTGTIPSNKGASFVSDLRMMVSATPNGFQPVAVYARRAAKPLTKELAAGADSWAMLGTNLSVLRSDGSWTTESERLLLMDMKDFNRLGLGTDDLIDGYVQTVMATIAIDRMASRLVDKRGRFDMTLYSSLNSDEALLREIMVADTTPPSPAISASVPADMPAAPLALGAPQFATPLASGSSSRSARASPPPYLPPPSAGIAAILAQKKS